MSYTSVTAVIFTVRHLSMAASLILTFFIMLPVYWLVVRRCRRKLLVFGLSLLVVLLVAMFLSYGLLLQTPVSIETVSVP